MASLLLACMTIVVATGPTSVRSEFSAWAPSCPSASGKIPRLVPDPADCRSVFVCEEGKPRRYFCPRGQVFDYGEQKCNEQKFCKKGSDELSVYESCPEVNGMELVLFPHPTNCGMYYVCDHGTAHPRKCSAGLHFNPKLKVCDWPYRANCEARVLTLQP